MKNLICTQDHISHLRWSPSGKKTMAGRLDKVILDKLDQLYIISSSHTPLFKNSNILKFVGIINVECCIFIDNCFNMGTFSRKINKK